MNRMMLQKGFKDYAVGIIRQQVARPTMGEAIGANNKGEV